MSSTSLGQVAEVELIPDFPTLLRQHQRMVFSVALHLVRDRMAAEEIAQDVFLKLHQNLFSMKSAAHIEFWLRRVTVHRAIDYGRKHRNDPNVALDELQMPATEAQNSDPFIARRLQALCRQRRIPGARLIPLGELPGRLSELDSADEIVLQCKGGTRSARALHVLSEAGFRKLYNLEGGIMEWAERVDPSMPKY